MREAQADDSLAHICRLRRVIQGMWQFKKFSISRTGNRPNTRLLSTYHSLANNIQKHAHIYRSAYAALQVLDPGGMWSHCLRPLLDRDICGPGKDPDDPTQNGRYKPSWIWLVVHKPSTKFEVLEEDFNESMRVEWAKVMARAARWKEELLIVQEEIRRVLAYFAWKSKWLVDQASRRVIDDDLEIAKEDPQGQSEYQDTIRHQVVYFFQRLRLRLLILDTLMEAFSSSK